MSILDKFRLDGKVAIITGASKGIGESMAVAFGQVGATVIVSSRKQDAVDEVADALKKEGINAAAIQAHNGEPKDLQNLIDQTIKMFGRIDVLVNNAATNPATENILDTGLPAFDKIIDVNLKGVFELSKLAYPHLKKTGGNIINISSIAGLRADPRTGIYCVSKAGLISLTQVLARAWAKDKIRVNAICPGLVKTKISELLWKDEKAYEESVKIIPMGRMAEPEEMQGLALFLASEASSYCTGGIFVADGGAII